MTAAPQRGDRSHGVSRRRASIVSEITNRMPPTVVRRLPRVAVAAIVASTAPYAAIDGNRVPLRLGRTATSTAANHGIVSTLRGEILRRGADENRAIIPR